MPCPSWITDTSTVLDVTALLAAAATIVTALEFIALRGEFRRYGLFDPQVQSATTSSSVLTRHLTRVSYPHVGVQLIFAVLVVLCIALDVSPALPLVVLAITTVLRTYLLRYGGEGADHMAQVVTISAAIAFVFSGNTTVGEITLVFITAQLSLAYGASGVAKLFGRTWRSGTAVQGVLHTAFGHTGIVRSSWTVGPVQAGCSRGRSSRSRSSSPSAFCSAGGPLSGRWPRSRRFSLSRTRFSWG